VVELKPKELEERFRIKTLPNDTNQIVIVISISLLIVLGFLGLEIFLLPYKEVHPFWVPSRIVASIASLIAIGLIHRQSNPKRVDRVTFAWGLVIILHMFVINLTRPRDYMPVIVWDILTISGIYFLLILPSQYKIFLAFLLTGSSGVIWVINRVRLADPFESMAVLAAYFFSNVYGIFVTVRHDRARRQHYALLNEETKSRRELTNRTRELEKAQEEMRCLAMTDPLTGISNRRHFMNQIAEELERTKRYGLPFSLMMIDVDNLKEINDTYGHKAGDKVLRSFAKHCLTKLRSVDRFARFGGDEFIALLVQTGPVKAKEVAARLLAGIEDLEIQVEKKSIRITVSIGLTTTEDILPVEELIKRADEALYQSKNGGRNQVATL
jgi:diguanylate cyclase (GGDEF)-like protein